MDAMRESVPLKGLVVARLFGEDGALKQTSIQSNLITEIGDEYYAERAAGIATPPDQVTGMKLGTGITAASKTGAGAALVAYIAASQRPMDAGYPTSALSGTSRRITWRATWAAGVATNTAIAEAVITNETPLADTPLGGAAGAAANTIARVVFGTAINKGASDSLEISWHNDVLGG